MLKHWRYLGAIIALLLLCILCTAAFGIFLIFHTQRSQLGISQATISKLQGELSSATSKISSSSVIQSDDVRAVQEIQKIGTSDFYLVFLSGQAWLMDVKNEKVITHIDLPAGLWSGVSAELKHDYIVVQFDGYAPHSAQHMIDIQSGKSILNQYTVSDQSITLEKANAELSFSLKVTCEGEPSSYADTNGKVEGLEVDSGIDGKNTSRLIELDGNRQVRCQQDSEMGETEYAPIVPLHPEYHAVMWMNDFDPKTNIVSISLPWGEVVSVPYSQFSKETVTVSPEIK